ncbi:sensor histidine kinase [Croceiramulus getboli]|nr:GAF domain-containing sensor histidine kinase [Flavobacteriaceae bacterium YJPT1-3]
MIPPKIPKNESERLVALRSYQLLDTLPEESYDNITALVAYICEAPISLITLVDQDRNYLKSRHGVDVQEAPRETSFCGHAINTEDDIFIVEDARKDPRFQGNPNIEVFRTIFYAGVPLINPQGFALGTLCVYDHQPRQLDDNQKEALKTLAKQVVQLFEQQVQNNRLKKLQERLTEKNTALRKFARVVSHDLKSPLSNIRQLVELLEEERDETWSDSTGEYLRYIQQSSNTLAKYIDGLLHYYDVGDTETKKEAVFIRDLFEEVCDLVVIDDDVEVRMPDENPQIQIRRSVVIQILLNLITNSLKYNSKPRRQINLQFEELDTHYQFMVGDNGDGIAEENKDSIFRLFVTQNTKDRHGDQGTGIGLALVKKLVDQQEGIIQLRSDSEEGTTFTFTVAK